MRSGLADYDLRHMPQTGKVAYLGICCSEYLTRGLRSSAFDPVTSFTRQYACSILRMRSVPLPAGGLHAYARHVAQADDCCSHCCLVFCGLLGSVDRLGMVGLSVR